MRVRSYQQGYRHAGALEGDPQPNALSDRLAVGQEVCNHGDRAPGGGEGRGGQLIFEMWLRAL